MLAGVAVGAVLAVVALKAAPLLTSKQPSGVRTPRIIRTQLVWAAFSFRDFSEWLRGTGRRRRLDVRDERRQQRLIRREALPWTAKHCDGKKAARSTAAVLGSVLVEAMKTTLLLFPFLFTTRGPARSACPLPGRTRPACGSGRRRRARSCAAGVACPCEAASSRSRAVTPSRRRPRTARRRR